MLRAVGLERVATSKIVAVQTDDITGTPFVPLGNYPCTQVIVYNDTGTALQVCYLDPSNPTVPAPGQTTLTVADGFAQPLRGITNSIQVGVKRSDSSTVAVNVKFVLEGVK